MAKKLLISLCTYQENNNLKNIILEIKKYCNNCDILVLDDFSDNITKKLLLKFINNKQIFFLQRKKKFGLGSAHKLSLIYSIKNNYDFLISLDADFSHQPKELPKFIKLAKKNCFIIGSRFVKTGKSDYTGLRKIVSYLGNKFSTILLNIPIKEVTTFYRLYDVNLLKKIPFYKMNYEGYSMGVELVWYMHKLNASLLEIPINFKDRKSGRSKLPRYQIFVSIFHVLKLFVFNFFNIKLSKPISNFDRFKCNHCDEFLLSHNKNIFLTCPICNASMNHEN